MLKVTYHGHACFFLDSGSHRVIIDPFLSGNPTSKAGVEDFPALDAILVTHGHADHLGDAVDLSKRCRAPIVAPFELAAFCQRRGATVHPMHIGGSHRFEFGRVKLTIAHHGSAFVDKTAEYTGNPCGFLVDLGGLTVYHAGDTGLFYDMKLIGDMNAIDLALLPIGDNFTMGPEDAAQAVELLHPRFVVPMHYATFDVLEQDATGFVEMARGLGAEVVVLAPGQTREFP
ncbi:MAG: metal-dependent hydrolase [Deferrisomatales bacterium]|nr:metal-dependent hydrolase [Deferrisomatales bacterium]